jgi:hypothetical protein
MSYVERRRFLWALFLIGAALAAAVAASGTTLIAMSFEELVQRSSAVARLRCVRVHSFLDRGEIWTETEFETVKTQKGVLGGLVRLRTPGGQVEGLHARVDGVPGFVAGEEVYLFLWGRGAEAEGFGVLGWTQGTFRVRRDEKSGAERVTQDSKVATFDSAARVFQKRGVEEMSVEKFERKVREALAKSTE